MNSWRRLLHPALLFVVVAWGINFTEVKVAIDGFAKAMDDPMRSAAMVTMLRYVGMWPILLILARLAGPLKFPWKVWRDCMATQLIASGIYMILWMEGMARSSAPTGAIVLGTAPFFIVGLSAWKGHDRLTRGFVGGGLLAFAGVCIVGLASQSDKATTPLGILLVFCSAVAWAISVIMARNLLQQVNPVQMLAMGLPGALVATVAYGIGDLPHVHWERVTPAGWFGVWYLILIAGVAAFIAYYKGLQAVGPAATSMTQFMIPPAAAIASWAMTGRALHWQELVGLVVVLAGLAWVKADVKPLGSHQHEETNSDQERSEQSLHHQLVEAESEP